MSAIKQHTEKAERTTLSGGADAVAEPVAAARAATVTAEATTTPARRR